MYTTNISLPIELVNNIYEMICHLNNDCWITQFVEGPDNKILLLLTNLCMFKIISMRFTNNICKIIVILYNFKLYNILKQINKPYYRMTNTTGMFTIIIYILKNIT